MKNHEISFKNAKKDKDGYATILVKFGEFYVPVKGKPLPLDKKEEDNYGDEDEINRLNLTHWNLKDIPEIAERVGVLCGEGYDDVLYWNGNETAWKFYYDGLGGIDNDDDDTIDWLDSKIEDLEDSLYKPHDDHAGNMGDEDVHCIYDGKSGISLWNDGKDKTIKRTLADELTSNTWSNFYDAATEAVEKARKSHKKIPYAEIGEAIRKRIDSLNDEDIAKSFLEIQ